MSAGGGAGRDERTSAIEEVLDHLLDPLEDLVPSADPPPPAEEEEEAAAPAAPALADLEPDPWLATVPLVYDGRGSVRDFLARVRWSERGCFRIPRLLARYALAAALFCSAIWLVLSAGGLR